MSRRKLCRHVGRRRRTTTTTTTTTRKKMGMKNWKK